MGKKSKVSKAEDNDSVNCNKIEVNDTENSNKSEDNDTENSSRLISRNSALNLKELRQRLELEDDFITSLIDSIPPKIYFGKEIRDKLMMEKHDAMDETAKEIQKRKGFQKEMSDKAKHKRAKLDPNFQKSVTQIQEELDSKQNKKRKKRKKKRLNTTPRAEGMEELHKKLEEKISEFKSKRGGTYDAENKREERVISKKLQRKRKAKKLNVKKSGEKVENEIMEVKERSSEKNPEKPPKKPKLSKATPVQKKEEKIIFSKFDFSEDGLEEKRKGEFSGKNYKKLLHNVSKEREKINMLKEKDPSKADEVVQRKSWKRAIEKAVGIKVKDDPSLLKKSLAKQEQKKRKNSKLWKERIEQSEIKMKSKQEKRKRNIQNKKKEKRETKIKRAKKKGRMVPGF